MKYTYLLTINPQQIYSPDELKAKLDIAVDWVKLMPIHCIDLFVLISYCRESVNILNKRYTTGFVVSTPGALPFKVTF